MTRITPNGDLRPDVYAELVSLIDVTTSKRDKKWRFTPEAYRKLAALGIVETEEKYLVADLASDWLIVAHGADRSDSQIRNYWHQTHGELKNGPGSRHIKSRVRAHEQEPTKYGKTLNEALDLAAEYEARGLPRMMNFWLEAAEQLELKGQTA